MRRYMFDTTKQQRFIDSMLHNILDVNLFETEEKSQKRLEVYRNNYMQTHCEVLRTKFPMVAKYLDDTFELVAVKYVCECPPKMSGRFSLYGEKFFEYLDDQLAVDLAKLEWLFQQVSMLEEDVVSGIPSASAEKIWWVRRSDVRLASFDFVITDAYDALIQDKPFPRIVHEKSWYVIFRKEGRVVLNKISKPSYEVLVTLATPHAAVKLYDMLTFSQTVWNSIFLEVFNNQILKVSHADSPKTCRLV